MRARGLHVAAVVLAAGAGTRFSGKAGAKLLADLGGRPVLEHVLAALRAAEPSEIVVVLGDGADAVERAIDWQRERRVRNPAPGRGIGSSLKLGIQTLDRHAQALDRHATALERDADALDGAFIVLGDQPRLRVEVLRALTNAAASNRPADRPFVVPRYADDVGPRNPVLLLRPAWRLMDGLDDEHGLGPLIDQNPDMVQVVEVSGRMPDVDTPDDLEALRQRG